MSRRKNDWGGAEKHGVCVLAGALQEKLTDNTISLLGAARGLLQYARPEIADLYRPIVERAERELLSTQ